MTFPSMLDWFPEFCDKLSALMPAEIAELLADLPADDATSERSDRPKRTKRQGKPSVRTLMKQAEKAGKPVSSITMPDGTVLHFGTADEHNEWDTVLRHGPH